MGIDPCIHQPRLRALYRLNANTQPVDWTPNPVARMRPLLSLSVRRAPADSTAPGGSLIRPPNSGMGHVPVCCLRPTLRLTENCSWLGYTFSASEQGPALPSCA